MVDIRVKICGLSQAAHVSAVVAAGADYVGFVFFEKSPRNVSYSEAADLAAQVPDAISRVALVVNATDDELTALTQTVPLDMLQLHGSESPERVAEVRTKFQLPVMKAVGIGSADDLATLAAYEAVADQILADTKPPKDADRPGGNAMAFDWSLVTGRDWAVPWMLAGGLNPYNVADAIRQTGATQVDVSSGVESGPGDKDADLIRTFVASARSA